MWILGLKGLTKRELLAQKRWAFNALALSSLAEALVYFSIVASTL